MSLHSWLGVAVTLASAKVELCPTRQNTGDVNKYYIGGMAEPRDRSVLSSPLCHCGGGGGGGEN